ncbi:MAG: UbiA prenyltransferase [Hyphomicrobiales bacterium]|nr:UbiA prenyltransferase [Hyphomicrobiales bacterium]
MTAILKSRAPAFALLRLGRVSNIPTVWTNVIAAATLAGGSLDSRIATLLAAMSAFYVAGMYLNDFFDRRIDTLERADRPIPTGEIGAVAVAAIGFGLLAAGIVLLAPFGLLTMGWGAALAAVIVLYDLWHKRNPFSPLIMGMCRALVYAVTAVAMFNEASGAILVAAIALTCHVAGLTYAAKQEHINRVGSLWPLLMLAVPIAVCLPALAVGIEVPLALLLLVCVDVLALRLLVKRPAKAVPTAVGMLIAAICLVDATVVARAGGGLALTAACALAYPLTRMLQRVVPGT